MSKALNLIQEAKEKKSIRLDIGNCGLDKLPAELLELKWLKQLDLSYNSLSSLKNIDQLKQLEVLVLSHTKIKTITPIKSLKQLKRLGLRHTSVKDISPLKDLEKLEYLGLQSTPVEDLSPMLDLIKKGIEVNWESQSRGIIIENCSLTNPPIEIVRQGSKAILNYFNQIKEQGTIGSLYEAKLIIVGNLVQVRLL